MSSEKIQNTLDRTLQCIIELKALLRDPPKNATQQMQSTFDAMLESLVELKGLLRTNLGATPTVPQPHVPTQRTSPPSVRAIQPPQDNTPATFEELKEILNSPKWPEAVNVNLVCDPENEQDKIERGKGILELMIEEDLAGLKFLDVGCGEGHCAYLAHEFNPALSVGYDIQPHPAWQKFAEDNKENVVFTTDFDTVAEKGPYNVILLFDVMDHLQNEEPRSFLTKLSRQLAPEGKIYIRYHPWTSRHATHLYHNLNKAYAHLVFSPEELKKILPECKYQESNIGVRTPLATYNGYIEGTGLKVVSRREITEKVEPFFRTPKLAQRICTNTGFSQFPEFQLSLQFVDAVLQKS